MAYKGIDDNHSLIQRTIFIPSGHTSGIRFSGPDVDKILSIQMRYRKVDSFFKIEHDDEVIDRFGLDGRNLLAKSTGNLALVGVGQTDGLSVRNYLFFSKKAETFCRDQ